jgi:alkyl hydroperoxide reductase subunit AhpC
MSSYESVLAEFEGNNAQVLGISVDSVPCKTAWGKSLGGISFPLVSDFWPHGAVAEQYGVLGPDGIGQRAVFVVDKQGVIRYIDISAERKVIPDVGRLLGALERL